jgi:uncharacterized protein (DUF1330 family)
VLTPHIGSGGWDTRLRIAHVVADNVVAVLEGRRPPNLYNPEVWVSRETPMPAYWVARSKINDPVEYKRYTDRVPEIIRRYQGTVLARGGRFQILEGPAKFGRFVVIEFPSLEQAVACFNSPEYQAAAAFRRQGAGEVELVIVEGGDATPV